MRDPHIRQLLRNTKLQQYMNDGASRIVEEMKLPAIYARIDIAVINGHLHGFEIKSASDTLQRLPGQIEAYSKIFDYLYIVTEGKYYNKILESTPKWIGVYVCEEKNGTQKVKRVRVAKKNKGREAFYIAKLLWREEIVDILEEYKIPYRKKDRNWLLCETLASSMEIEKLSEIVRHNLKNRPQKWLNSSTEDYAIG